MGFMEIVNTLFGGDKVVKEVGNLVEKWLPERMSESEKKQFEFAVQKFFHEKQMELISHAHEQDKEFNKRITEMEGTASDLKGVPIVGSFILLLRGAFRPIFSYFTLAVDYMVFCGKWDISSHNELAGAFYAMNVLVLTFYFGERALKNLLPYIGKYFGVKNGNSE